MKIKLTKSEIKKEIIRCGRDPVAFINDWVRISHPIHGVIPFNTFEYQDDMISDFNAHRFNIVLKARQLGASTVVASYILWLLLFHRSKNVLVVATKQGTAANLVKKVRSQYKRLPEWMKIAKIETDNVAEFALTNESGIKASSTSSDAGRSEALSFLILDEAAFIDGLDELWTAAYSTLSTGGRCIALSTPNGVGNWFERTYMEAEASINKFHPIKIMWDEHPDRDEAWFLEETKNMSKRQIAQELLCSFNQSGETVFDAEDLERMLEACVDPLWRRGFDRNLWIWEEAKIENSYLLSADVSRGDGEDFSAFHVVNLNNDEVVAEYQGKITPDLFAKLIYETGKEYNYCMVVVENNNIGYSVLEKLVAAQYPNLYWMRKGSGEYIEQYIAENQSNTIPGFTTSQKTRPLIVSKLEEFVRKKKFNTKSLRMVSEMKRFVWMNGKPQAMKGGHDDLVMSAAIAAWIKDTALNTSKHTEDYKKAFLGSMIYASTSFDTGMKKRKDGTGDAFSDVFQKPSNALNDYLQHSWVLTG